MVQGGKYLSPAPNWRSASAGGRWRLCCRAQDSNARDVSQLFFGRSLFYMSYCGAICFGEAYLLQLVVLHPFFLVALDIKFPSTKGLSTIL